MTIQLTLGYVGPAGIGGIGMLLVVLVVLLIGLAGLVLYPVRVFLRHRRSRKNDLPVVKLDGAQQSPEEKNG